MERAERFRDVEREMERFMVNLYKRSIRGGGLNPKDLKGDWAEASTLLRAHFGKLTRTADQNRHRLVTLYRMAVDEVKASQS